MNYGKKNNYNKNLSKSVLPMDSEFASNFGNSDFGRRKRGMEKLGDLINSSIDKYGLGDISQSLIIFGRFKFHLADLMGEKFLNFTKCEKIQNGFLYVKGSNPAVSNELQILKYEILQKLQKDFGKEKIRNLKILN
ncbi:DUF721 domain-containing protein [Candidatus Gracilibacteria bacterium]|nr:DUF721 domain-containing protein [Candidatus Gracilibacteria bacterium]